MFVSTQRHFRGTTKQNVAGVPLFNHTSSVRPKMFPITEIMSTALSEGFRIGANTPQIVCKDSLPFEFYPPLPKLKRTKRRKQFEEKKVRKMRSVIDVDKLTYEEIMDDLLVHEREADKYKHLTLRQLERALRKNLKNKNEFLADVYQHPAHWEKTDDEEYFKHARVDKLEELEDGEDEEEYEDPENRNLEELPDNMFTSQTKGVEPN